MNRCVPFKAWTHRFNFLKGPLQTVVIGTDAPGTVLETCSPDFLALFEKPGLQISKGQGNYEALSARGEFSIMVGDPWQGRQGDRFRFVEKMPADRPVHADQKRQGICFVRYSFND